MTITNGRAADDVTQRLVELGLAADEASVYVNLRRLGPAKARDVAAAVALPRPKSYRLLERLIQRGFVEATSARPTRFQAVEPERLIEELHTEEELRRAALGRAEQDLLPALAAIAVQGCREEPRALRVIRGRGEVSRIGARLLRGASASFDLFDVAPASASPPWRLRAPLGAEEAPPPRAPASPTDMWAALPSALLARGRGVVRGRLLLDAHLAAVAPLGALELAGCEIRVAEASQQARFLVADGRQLLLDLSGGHEPRAEEAAALWSDTPALVGTLASLFEASWRAAPPRVLATNGVLAPSREGAAPA